METVPADYGKRVYQGVRVKHTVKDLLAEKRSRQTNSLRRNGSVVSSQPSFIPLPSSPTASGYYGVRRSLATDMDLHNSKDISSEVYGSSLLPKSLAYESPATQGYSLSLDAHLIDQYLDQRAGSIPSGTSAVLGNSTSSFPSDSAHYFSRDTWEQSVPDNLGQLEACPEPLQVAPVSSCLSAHEPGTASHCRNPNWNVSLSGIQSYSFHPLEDVHYPAVFSASSNSPFSSFMAAAANDPPGLKMLPGSSEESSDTAALQDSSSFWPKEDSSPLWGSYEERRTY
ncbi:POU domain class 2-associating factor 2 [Pantherophis guttatus]|uniref:POU domain class 2-associating factor 2 n=1 Tax=Pantherophis guttatus TaxID=94885 RepID=A0A6P9CCF6_PANGU|nr:POU domain class 2-associating factor 2 [Pantherophis guttatus]